MIDMKDFQSRFIWILVIALGVGTFLLLSETRYNAARLDCCYERIWELQDRVEALERQEPHEPFAMIGDR